MKNIILLAIVIIGGSFWYKKSTCEPFVINFAGKEWLFPSTVEEAVKNHQLDYKPPGYYHKIDSSGMEVLLSYHYKGGDFFNENQPKETLYPRDLHSYVIVSMKNQDCMILSKPAWNKLIKASLF